MKIERLHKMTDEELQSLYTQIGVEMAHRRRKHNNKDYVMECKGKERDSMATKRFIW